MLTWIWPVFLVGGEFIVKFLLIGHILLNRRHRSETNLAWITVILAVPLLGMVAYLLVGEVRLSRRRIERNAIILERVTTVATAHITDPSALNQHIASGHAPIATLAESVQGNIPLGGNELCLLGETAQFVARLAQDIDEAHVHCHLLFYIFLTDHTSQRVAEALMRAVRRGVECRVLVDAIGSRPFARSALRREMEDAGVQVVEMLKATPLRAFVARLDLRNHRKIVVIDGLVAFTGSHNIADAEFAVKRKYGPWVDAMVRVRGPVARDLQMLFVQDWYMETQESLESVLRIEPSVHENGVVAQIMGTGPNSYNAGLRQVILTAFHAAKEELIMTTPYFTPDEPTVLALRTAARRGVDTTLIVPARNDSPLVAAASRSHYESLLRAGVRIFEFHGGLLHAKTLTLDRNLALISSANLDRRSFELNFEVSMLVYDTDFASELRFLQTFYLSKSERVKLGRWQRRPWPAKLWENAAGTLSPLL